METTIFGGGCFWCTEAAFKMLRGVKSVEPGYAGGATLVFHRDGLAEALRHARSEIAAEDVGRPAGGERYDEYQRLCGKGGWLCRSRSRRQRGKAREHGPAGEHDSSSNWNFDKAVQRDLQGKCRC